MEHEDQQVEQVKKFIKEYGPWVVAGLVIGLGAMFGWRSYQGAQLAEAQYRTHAYQTVLEQLQQAESLSDAAFAEEVLAELDGTAHGALTRMQLASKAVATEDYDAAATFLEHAYRDAGSRELQSLIAIRLARVEIARGQYDAAASALNRIPGSAYAALKAEVRGDLYYAQGQYSQARSAYQEAVALANEGTNPFLQMKLDNLAANE